MSGSEIASPSNTRIKAAVRLRDRGERDRTGRTIIDGARELNRALTARATIEEAFVCDALATSGEAREAIAELQHQGASLVTVTRTVYEKLAFGDRSDGIVAIIQQPSTDLAALALPENPLILVLEGVEKPGNLGAALRSADGAGADAVIAAGPRTDLLNPNAIRASLGTIFSVGLASAETDAVRTFLRERGIRIVAARVDADTNYTEADLTGPIAIALGSEATGLTDAWSEPDVIPVRLAMHGIADSLNVSVAAAVLLYEARRQRDAWDHR